LTDGKQQLDKLIQGNERFASGTPTHPNSGFMRRRETALNGQFPIAATLACADSRVPIEMIFDQGIGDIFSVKTAGNIIDDVSLGSLELGVYKFEIPLLLVLGHTDCGAIKLAVDANRLSGKMSEIIHRILPVVEQVTSENPDIDKDELVNKVTEENVRSVIKEISEKSEIISERVELGTLIIKGGVLDLESGEVEWLD
jgi:carbonic anhydrase